MTACPISIADLHYATSRCLWTGRAIRVASGNMLLKFGKRVTAFFELQNYLGFLEDSIALGQHIFQVFLCMKCNIRSNGLKTLR